jgi:hypothetical protein
VQARVADSLSASPTNPVGARLDGVKRCFYFGQRTCVPIQVRHRQFPLDRPHRLSRLVVWIVLRDYLRTLLFDAPLQISAFPAQYFLEALGTAASAMLSHSPSPQSLHFFLEPWPSGSSAGSRPGHVFPLGNVRLRVFPDNPDLCGDGLPQDPSSGVRGEKNKMRILVQGVTRS